MLADESIAAFYDLALFEQLVHLQSSLQLQFSPHEPAAHEIFENPANISMMTRAAMMSTTPSYGTDA